MSSSQTPNAWAKPPSIVKLPTGKASDSSQSTATPAQASSNPHPPSNPPKGNPTQPTPNATTNKQPPTNVATSLISSSSVPSSTGNGNSGSGKNIKFGANVASSTPSPAASGNGSGNANDMRSNGRAWSNGSGWSNKFEDQRNQQRGHQNRGRPHQSNKRRGSFNSQQSTQSQQSNQRTGQSSAPVSLPQPPTTATSIKFGTVETTLPSATSVNKENAPKNQTAQETRQQAWGSSNQSVSSKEVNQTKVGTKQSIESASKTNETSAQEHTTGSEIADSDSKILAPVARQPSVKTFDKIPRVRSTPPVPSANGYVPPIQGFNAKPSNLRPSQPHLSGDAVGSSDLPQQQVSTPFSQQPTSVSSHAPAASSAQAPSHIHNPSSHIPQTSHHTYQSNPSFHQAQPRSYKSQHPRGVKAGHSSSIPATHSIPPTNIHGAPIPGSNTVTPAVPSVYPGAVPAPMQPNVYPMNMPGYGYQQPYTAAYDPAQYQYYPYYPTMPNPVQASQPQPAPIPTSGNRVIPSSAPFYSTSPSSSFAVPPQPKPQPVERSKSKSSAIRITNPNTGETYSPSELAAKAQSPKKEPVIPIPASVATPPTKPVIASEPAPDSTMRKSKAIPIRRPDEGAKNEDGITTGENSGDAASVKSLPIERSEKSPTRGKSPEKSKSPKRTPSPVKVTAKSDVSETEKPLKDTNTLEKKEISKENKAADEERTPSPAKAKSVERSALPKKQQSAEQSISTESIKGEVIDVKERGRSPTRSPPLPTQPSTPPAPTPQSPAKSASRSRSKSPTKTPATENFEQKCRRMYPDGVVPAPENIILKNKREVCRYAKDFLVQFRPLCEAMPKLLVDLGIFASSNKSGGGMGGRQSSGGRRQTQAANRSGGLGGLGSLQAQARSRPDQPASKLSSAERFAQSLASNMTRQPSMGRDSSRGGRGRDDSHGMDRQRSNRDRKNRGQQQNVALNMPPLEDYAPLEKSENRWTPGMKVSGQLSEEEIANQKLGRKAKGLLNKITLDNFERVSKQIVDIGVATISGLKTVIDEIFAKATDEANFASIYAMLCLKLYQEMKPVQELSEEDNKRVFRKLLLSQCQSGFENLPKWTQTEEEKQELSEAGITEDADGPEESKKDESSAKKSSDTNEDEYEQMQKIKRRALGNITFIGELFKKGLLTEKIMHTCVQRLISNTDEEYIEALCKLLTTVGASLEHQKSKNLIDHYFERMVKIQSLTTLGSRIQFMIQDVIDLRANKWVLRTVVAASGPKTIAQIRQEVCLRTLLVSYVAKH
ncbi:hypothetical protein BKA69DRAFT_140564 [Paraphysoderma sedebokerense]|nr:hypothetical protein BKA69DRAFT_140564 [Paraphysoderma sedebokerense]